MLGGPGKVAQYVTWEHTAHTLVTSVGRVEVIHLHFT